MKLERWNFLCLLVLSPRCPHKPARRQMWSLLQIRELENEHRAYISTTGEANADQRQPPQHLTRAPSGIHVRIVTAGCTLSSSCQNIRPKYRGIRHIQATRQHYSSVGSSSASPPPPPYLARLVVRRSYHFFTPGDYRTKGGSSVVAKAVHTKAHRPRESLKQSTWPI